MLLYVSKGTCKKINDLVIIPSEMECLNTKFPLPLLLCGKKRETELVIPIRH